MKLSKPTLNGFLDQGCAITGEVTFVDLLRVHGRVTGTVRSDRELLVGEGGEVDGEILVGRLTVAGTVRGTVHANDRVVVHTTGRILAEVFTPTLVVDEGGMIEGQVHMTAAAKPQTPTGQPSGKPDA
ncbi:MAG: polymer-forming cytoskeletal protein [Acidobacteria bacterium]|nr:polymer-forming cytoskeletal protein [Acidobacteriota bacterium]